MPMKTARMLLLALISAKQRKATRKMNLGIGLLTVAPHRDFQVLATTPSDPIFELAGELEEYRVRTNINQVQRAIFFYYLALKPILPRKYNRRVMDNPVKFFFHYAFRVRKHGVLEY
jgi:hypothetical protein